MGRQSCLKAWEVRDRFSKVEGSCAKDDRIEGSKSRGRCDMTWSDRSRNASKEISSSPGSERHPMSTHSPLIAIYPPPIAFFWYSNYDQDFSSPACSPFNFILTDNPSPNTPAAVPPFHLTIAPVNGIVSRGSFLVIVHGWSLILFAILADGS